MPHSRYPPSMLYRAVRTIHRGYSLTVLWGYVALFGLAFCFMFMFPPATLALLFAGIFGLVAVYVGHLALGVAENSLARGSIKRSICPNCRQAIDQPATPPTQGSARSTCAGCGAVFERNGAEVDSDDAIASTSVQH